MEYVFTGPMKNSLVENRAFIVNNLTNVEGILDHLVASNVFADAEDVIKPNGTRKEKVRDLLDGLVRRPARDYWKFITILYHESIKEGNIADVILRTYGQKGGAISPEVSRLQQDYNDHHRHDGQLLCIQNAPTSRPPAVPQGLAPAQAPPHQPMALGAQMPPAHFHLPVASSPHPSTPSSGGLSMAGNVLTTPSENSTSRGSGQQSDDWMDIDSADRGHQGANGLQTGIAEEGESAYYRARREKPDDVYRMESTPRGMALIIDNDKFDKPQLLPHRNGTAEDRESLKDMLSNLSFDVSVRQDLTAQEMKEALRDFSRNPRMQTVDCCIIAIMSHGSKGGLIFGVDGDLAGSNPAQGTYINVSELRDFFSSTNCPALSEKPKLFIVQACRGVFEDTNNGLQRVGRDVIESPESENSRSSVYLDMCWLHSTVEDMVSYRNILIPSLVNVFTEYAATEHVKDMMTKIVKEVKQNPLQVPAGTLYPVAEDSYTLWKKWYLNPLPFTP